MSVGLKRGEGSEGKGQMGIGVTIHSLLPRSVLQPHLLLPALQHHGLAGPQPDFLLPVGELVCTDPAKGLGSNWGPFIM